jgi:hypothetical protein
MQQHDIRPEAWKRMAVNVTVPLIDDGMVLEPVDQGPGHGSTRSFAPNDREEEQEDANRRSSTEP